MDFGVFGPANGINQPLLVNKPERVRHLGGLAGARQNVRKKLNNTGEFEQRVELTTPFTFCQQTFDVIAHFPFLSRADCRPQRRCQGEHVTLHHYFGHDSGIVSQDVPECVRLAVRGP